MPTLLLLRNYDLSEDELQKLPKGCRGVLIDADRSAVVARADVPTYMPISDVVQLAVAMGRAIPNTQIIYSANPLAKAKWITVPNNDWAFELSDNTKIEIL